MSNNPLKKEKYVNEIPFLIMSHDVKESKLELLSKT